MREYIDGNTVASQVQLEMADHKGTFLLVEGRADILLYGRFRHENCRLIDATRKNVTIEAVEVLRSRDVYVACAIVDDDYDRLLGHSALNEGIFVTDENDVELMIVNSEAFDDFVNEKCDPRLVAEFCSREGMSVRDYILKEASIIGSYRLINKRQDIGISFKKIGYAYVNQSDVRVNEVELVEEIGRRSNRDSSDIDDFKRDLGERARSARDEVIRRQDLCNGHDVCFLVGCSLKGKFGRRGGETCSSSEVESDLRLCYHWYHFARTTLASRLREWAAIHGRVFKDFAV